MYTPLKKIPIGFWSVTVYTFVPTSEGKLARNASKDVESICTVSPNELARTDILGLWENSGWTSERFVSQLDCE